MPPCRPHAQAILPGSNWVRRREAHFRGQWAGRRQPSADASAPERARRPKTRPLPAPGPQCRGWGSWRGACSQLGLTVRGAQWTVGRCLCAPPRAQGSPGRRDPQGQPGVQQGAPPLPSDHHTGFTPTPPSLLSCRDTNWQKHGPTSRWPGAPAASSQWGKCAWARQQA